MRYFFSLIVFLLCSVTMQAQGVVRGRVLDKQSDEPLQFVNVRVNDDSGKLVKGGMTDAGGHFNFSGLPLGSYTLQVSFVGYKSLTRSFLLTQQKPHHHYNALYLAEDTHTLKEVKVTGQRSQMKLEVDRKTFTVDEVLAAAGGSVSDLLENIPSVEVTTDGEISLRGNSSVEVWINGKASGLTSDNRAEILQQIPAESIERIEVIDNPSAKFSPEGSAGIINVIMKRDRRAGYYGSMRAGADNQGGWNTGANVNYASKWMDAYANMGYRRRRGNGGNTSDQRYRDNETSPFSSYQLSEGENNNRGGNLFARAGLTLHLTADDDLSLSGMMTSGNRSNDNKTTYEYGTFDDAGNSVADRILRRMTWGDGDNRMYNAELDYTHLFDKDGKHKLEASLSFSKWKSDGSNEYLNDTSYVSGSSILASAYSYQYRPMDINSRNWEAKVDYENKVSDNLKIEAGYNGRFSHENTPQTSYEYNAVGTAQRLQTDDSRLREDPYYYNRFIYDSDVHALYATVNMKMRRFSVMTGLRGEYWKVNTHSSDYYQQETPFSKDYFQLFPSLFLNYELTKSSQLQLNYTRRLKRPRGGVLNPFKNTRDASVIEFGNPELTPEYTNAFSLNYLKTWDEHTLSLSSYYKPTTDVIERIRYQGTEPTTGEDVMYMTSLNVAKSQSAGAEVILKDKLWRILELTTTLNAYYYKLDGFSTMVEGQTVTGDADENFAWDARVQASVILPYSITVQATGNYRSRSLVSQGYRKGNGALNLGLRKTFFNKALALAVNWRDVFNTRQTETYTEGPTFWRYQKNRRDPRINVQLTWNFGNMMGKKKKNDDGGGDDDDGQGFGGYDD
ncbi:MAG: TonB-dependent receptor [Prevotella sp.]|nr:TonB-dependent receptor [Prevotella sp.]